MTIPAFDCQTGNKLCLPSSGGENYQSWLKANGYTFESYAQLTTGTDPKTEAELYCKHYDEDTTVWAVYIPELEINTEVLDFNLETECLNFNIYSIEKAKDLIDTAQQLIAVILPVIDLANTLKKLWPDELPLHLPENPTV
ncbi:MAG: hypothetical protein SAJ12_03765 [Jaaginema sp. PMC 1079.18]|nr:hypothetical protein [Jaaginema sp. PMC 1080.18]MEC4850106.1 hypothetical protein [Jaaginema sp. PMC 1079.18]MEC4864806.1 hypothetical protein [Jaaginema sp. PMC 1078.18]